MRNSTPVADLADQFAGDLLLARRSASSRRSSSSQFAQRQAAVVVDRAIAEPHGRGVVAQAAAAARRAFDLVDQMLQPRAERRRQPRGFFQRRVEPFELEAEQRRRRPSVLFWRPASAVPARHVEPLFAGAVQDDPPLPGVELVERHVERHARVARAGRRASTARPAWPTFGQRATAPSASVSFGSRSSAAGFAPICDAQPFARRAPAERAVEREVVRRERLEAAAAALAGQVLAVRRRSASAASGTSSSG